MNRSVEQPVVDVEKSSSVEDLIISSSTATPYVRAEWQLGKLTMAGESYPDNAYDLFDQIISWLEKYLKKTSRSLDVELQLSYLNTSSVRGMVEIFDSLQNAFESGRELSVSWICDRNNVRSVEMGEEFKEDYTFNFVIRIV